MSRRRFSIRIRTLVGVLTFLGISFTDAGAAPTIEPIAFVGHSSIFGPDGSEIVPTPSFMKAAISWYTAELSKGVSESDRESFNELRRSLLENLEENGQSALVVDGALLDWLLDRGNRKDVDTLRGKVRLLNHLLHTKLPESAGSAPARSLDPFKLEKALLDRLGRIGNLNRPPHFLDTTGNGGEAYRKECAAAGVPIPPDFGPGSAWASQGVMDKSNLFIVRTDDAQVLTWKSSSPEGLCIALPRYSADKTVQADGVICLGKTSSKVCFWDNQVKDGDANHSTFPFPLGTSQSFSRWAGGTDLRGGVGGICSDCHAGENPYIVHGQVLGSLADSLPTFPDNWYVPIVRMGDTNPWPENPGPSPMGSPNRCSDSSCHGTATDRGEGGRLPKLSLGLPGYCGAVMRSSLGALAPPVPGRLNAPPSMPKGLKAGTLACTPGLTKEDPRYRPCSATTTVDCTPTFSDADPRRNEPDFPKAYKVSCTKEIADLLALCAQP